MTEVFVRALHAQNDGYLAGRNQLLHGASYTWLTLKNTHLFQ